MPDSTSRGPGSRRLKDYESGYVQVLIHMLRLEARNGGVVLGVDLDDEQPILADTASRRSFFRGLRASPRSEADGLAEALRQWSGRPAAPIQDFDLGPSGIRYASGGVLPIARLEGVDHAVLFYRDIFPIGWNLANGGAEGRLELIEPDRIGPREFAEELVVYDPRQRALVVPTSGTTPPPSLTPDQLRALKLGNDDSPSIGQRPLAIDWVEGPDRVRVGWGRESTETSGVFVNVTVEDRAIEVDRVARFELGDGWRLIDGELATDGPLRRIVGLFALDRLRSVLERGDRELVPDRIFQDGEAIDPRGFLDQLGDYAAIQAAVRGPEQAAEFRDEPHKLDLCPVVRSLLRRWLLGLRPWA